MIMPARTKCNISVFTGVAAKGNLVTDSGVYEVETRNIRKLSTKKSPTYSRGLKAFEEMSV